MRCSIVPTDEIVGAWISSRLDFLPSVNSGPMRTESNPAMNKNYGDTKPSEAERMQTRRRRLPCRVMNGPKRARIGRPILR
jgi:hypothetical protein